MYKYRTHIMKFNSDNYVPAILNETANKLEPFIAKVQFGMTSGISMINSYSVCGIITKTLGRSILKTTPPARWIASSDEKDLKIFSNEPIMILEKLASKTSYNDWTFDDACFTEVDECHKNTIGRVFFSSPGLAIVQRQSKKG